VNTVSTGVGVRECCVTIIYSSNVDTVGGWTMPGRSESTERTLARTDTSWDLHIEPVAKRFVAQSVPMGVHCCRRSFHVA
jgi:hypothetical protein